jgi:hypothetical protein
VAVQQGAVQGRAVPRIEIRSPSPNSRWMVTPGTRCSDFGDVLVRELADILGGDDVDDGVGVALGGDRGLQRGADAGDDDFVDGVELSCAKAGAARANARRWRTRQNGLVEISHTRLLPFFQASGSGAEPQAQSDTNSSADIRRKSRYFSGLGGNCDGNLSDDKAKKEPIADHVLIGMKMVICYREARGAAMARFCAGVRN